ncbi:Putative exoglucanase a (1,4-beta-cellobiosidase) protein [Minicystis rosea]|nr:Putative exoglucanase a (1,4-beta-cellobiosidase) protein [Minicystis rosea]
MCAACGPSSSPIGTGGDGGSDPTTTSSTATGTGGAATSSSSSSGTGGATTSSSSGTGGNDTTSSSSGTGGSASTSSSSGTGGSASTSSSSSSSSSGNPAMCGNGIVEAGEDCDDGNHVNTDACTNECKNAACGDGFQQPGEECDLGAQNSNTGACTMACKNAVCGDGFVGPNEACDDGNQLDNDGCTNACKLPGCGDGIVQTGEQCDIGAQNSNTGTCTLACKLPACGDGFLQAGEQCDLGAQNANTGTCTLACKNAVCGDGFVQPGEQCDLGAQNSNTGTCTTACKLPVCGDGFVQPGEQCDLGAQNANTGTCTMACKLPVCGDGFVQAGEQCDDGNTTNGDGCDSTCKSSPGAPVWTQPYNVGTDDGWNAVTVDPSGNVIVAGFRTVGTTTDAVVAKYGPTGNQIWVRTYNGAYNGNDVAFGVDTDAQGNIVVVGYETSAGTQYANTDMWIRKYDASGTTIWTKTYLGYNDTTVFDENDVAYGVALNAAGDVFVAAARAYDSATDDTDILIYKLSGATGAFIWGDADFSDYTDKGTSIAVDAAGRIIAAGYKTNAAGDIDMWIRKYQDGATAPTVLWTTLYDDAAHDNDYAFGVATDASNNVIVVGAEAVSGQIDASIRKYDANGNFLWTQRRAGTAGGTDAAGAVACDATGNIYVGGSDTVAGNTTNAWTMKYAASGTPIVWSDVFNGTGNGDDYVNGVALDTTGNTYAAGYVTNATPVAWLRKYSP